LRNPSIAADGFRKSSTHPTQRFYLPEYRMTRFLKML
jgi:hypothetical protein